MDVVIIELTHSCIIHAYTEKSQQLIVQNFNFKGISISQSTTQKQLQALSPSDLRNILYLLVGKIELKYQKIPPDLKFLTQKIQFALQKIETDLKLLGPEDLHNYNDMVPKYTKLQEEHEELKKKYNTLLASFQSLSQ